MIWITKKEKQADTNSQNASELVFLGCVLSRFCSAEDSPQANRFSSHPVDPVILTENTLRPLRLCVEN